MNTLENVRKPPHRKTVGIEIECVSLERPRYGHIGFWFAGDDASISSWPGHGVEYVSQPLSVQWMHRELNVLKKKVPAWEVNDSCGIHVHVSRQWLTLQRADAVLKFLKSLDDITMMELFGRKPNHYCRTTCSKTSRYCAINITNEATTEIRSFASGDIRWAKWCVDFSVYLTEHAKHLNLDAVLAYKEWWHSNN